MNRRTRNIICLWIIFLGLVNFVSYTIVYGYIGGDAKNGYIQGVQYFVRGHFIHLSNNLAGLDTPVSRGTWIYSYVHSISIPPTMAAIVLCTLILARPHIIATMKEGFISGQTLITIFATVVVLIVGVITIWFLLDFIHDLASVGS
jgi:polyferredoxin